MYVSFTTRALMEAGDSLFATECDIVPRVGETVTYLLAGFDKDSLDDGQKALDGKMWKVVDVIHDIQFLARYSQGIECVLEEVSQ